MRKFWLIAIPALLWSCQQIPLESDSGTASQVGGFQKDTPEWKGLKFARNRCSDCHSVEHSKDSPHPSAPTFEAIANKPGATQADLKQWLNTVHAFPRDMYFEIPAEHIDDLVAYMFTLRHQDDISVD